MKKLNLFYSSIVIACLFFTACSNGSNSEIPNVSNTSSEANIQGNNSEQWYDTKYLARYVYTATYDENIDINNPGGDTIIQTPNGNYYKIPNCDCIIPTFKSEDTTKNPPEAQFYMTAYEGYYISNEAAEKLQENIISVNFSKINEETNYWQWTTDEYSN